MTSHFQEEEYTSTAFVSLTIHFFDGKNLKYFVLNYNEFPHEKKTAANITDWFDNIKLNLIGTNSKFYITTDSARNIVCSFKHTDKRISCIAHSIHLAVIELFAKLKQSNTLSSKLATKILNECKRIATKIKSHQQFKNNQKHM